MKRYWAEIILLVAVVTSLAVVLQNKSVHESFDEWEEEQLPEMRFGLPVDSFFIVEGQIVLVGKNFNIGVGPIN